MSAAFDTLGVWLSEVPVGTIRLNSSGESSYDRTSFVFLESYREMAQARPVLGQHFEDDLSKRWHSRMRLPPFFSNLLPEGRLRDLVAARAGVSAEREFFLLAHVGEDLPGAVIVRPIESPLEPELLPPMADDEEPSRGDEDALRFSLAGVQLKFSMLQSGHGLTLPVRGQGGDWLVKLPHSELALVPENEFAVMTWAAASGIDTPEVRLVKVGDLHGLPSEAQAFSGNALQVRRFDRPRSGVRVHIEDFAQVLGERASQKYRAANYETLGKVVLTLAGEPALAQFIRRLVFVALSGNADAHLKNWSLIYPDRRTPLLAPAYDLVSTVHYPNTDGFLALNLARSKRFEDVSLASFHHFGERVGVDADWTVATALESVRAVRTAWSQLGDMISLPDALRATVERHVTSVPLWSEAATTG